MRECCTQMHVLTLFLQCLSTQSRKVPAMRSWPWWWSEEVQRRREAGGEIGGTQTGENQNRRWEFSMWNNSILNSIFYINIWKVKVIVALARALFQILNFHSSDKDFGLKKSGCVNSVNIFLSRCKCWPGHITPKPLGPVFGHQVVNHSYIREVFK